MKTRFKVLLLFLLTVPAAVRAQFNYTTNSGTITITEYTGSGATVTVPSMIDGLPVTSIASNTFGRYTNLSRVYFEGNAPSADSTVFSGDSNVIVYYLPGTIGWEPTFGGRPAALWQPQVQTTESSFGVRTNQFGFNINWASGMTVVVEACTNLANPLWLPLVTNTLPYGSLYFSDSQWTNHPGRFYRLRWPDPSRRAYKKPYMGINTWYTIGPVNGIAITNAANWLVSSGLKAAGYDTIQIDDGWNGFSDDLFSTWTAGAGWSPSSPFTHVVGATEGLTNAAAGVVARGYRVAYNVYGRTAGSFTMTFGGRSSTPVTDTGSWYLEASTAAQFVATPTSDFNGTVVFSLASLRDAGGNWIVSTTKFPQGLKSVVNYVHSLGLKLGIYMGDGGMDGFYGWFPSQDAVFCATYGFDMIKVDGLPGGGTDLTWLEVFAAACDRMYVTNNQAPIWIQVHAQSMLAVFKDPRLWSLATSIFSTGDVMPNDWWYVLNSMGQQHGSFRNGVMPHMGFWTTRYPAETRPGFSDGVSINEEEKFDYVCNGLRAMMGANALLSSPLEMATYMTNNWNDGGVRISLITNKNVIAIDQDPGMIMGYPISSNNLGYDVTWLKPLGTERGPEYAVGLWNQRTGYPQRSTNSFYFTNLFGSPSVMNVLDCWHGTNYLATNSITASMNAQDMRLFRLTPIGTIQSHSVDSGTKVNSR